MKILHWLNFDTALGASITSQFVASYLRVHAPIIATFTLFLAVQAIYNFDHLLDARAIRGAAISSRHRFYQKHFKVLSIYQLVLMFCILCLVYYLPESIIRAGIVLGLITLIYFILLFIVFAKKFILKEVFISMVFSSALFLAPVYTDGAALRGNLFILWCEITLLALANTLILSWYEYEADSLEGHSSLTVSLGKSTVHVLISTILTLLVGMTIFMIITGDLWQYQLIIALMTSVLAFALLGRKVLFQNERYRIIVDTIFFLPIILLV